MIGAWIACLVPMTVMAGAPVILSDSRVAQFKEATEAVQRKLSGAEVLEIGDPDIAAKVAGAPVVVAVGRKQLTAARQAAAGRPVVFVMVLGVSAADFSSSTTGVPLEADPRVVLAQLRGVAPSVKRVGVIFDPKASGWLVEQARAAAAGAGVQLVTHPLASPTEMLPALQEMAGSIDALWLPPDPKLYSHEVFNYLLGYASERKLPLMGFLEGLAEAGALAAVSPDYQQVGERGGQMAAEIMARPEASRLPVPPFQFAPGNLSVNLKTAGALGLTVPASALEHCHKVFR
jgi:putative ABC transport system substrate-binding protein